MNHRPRILPRDEAHARRLEQYRRSKARKKLTKDERKAAIDALLSVMLANPGPVERASTIAEIAAKYRRTT